MRTIAGNGCGPWRTADQVKSVDRYPSRAAPGSRRSFRVRCRRGHLTNLGAQQAACEMIANAVGRCRRPRLRTGVEALAMQRYYAVHVGAPVLAMMRFHHAPGQEWIWPMLLIRARRYGPAPLAAGV